MADEDILLKLVEVAPDKTTAIKHVIMFARNDMKRKRKRSLDYYAELILKITE